MKGGIKHAAQNQFADLQSKKENPDCRQKTVIQVSYAECWFGI